jgi:hypothetical protein
MDDVPAKSKLRSAEEEILALAREHGVTYQPTELDELANTFACCPAMTWNSMNRCFC